ncbi:MAG TPA: hypothetical protein VH637_01020 [Streptosporangiaceae bacterium]|jgi:hypothetical protein
MSMIEYRGPDDDGETTIADWDDSHSVAVITWRADGGGTHQQEVTGRPEAARLLRSIDQDDSLTLISAQLRRAGIGPAG